MSTLPGLLNHQVTAGHALTGKAASPMASPTSGSSGTNGSNSSSGNSATVSANDFLTLLVTEMQNQDPTANTDPNEYINQLVQVNSLEQLIDINQTLSTDVGSTANSSGSGTKPSVTAAASSAGNSAITPAAAATSGTAASNSASPVSGNLSAPNTNPAAERVGHSLTQRTRAAMGGGIPLQ
jgi:flagellar basal-body rod modification protein FlgD